MLSVIFFFLLSFPRIKFLSSNESQLYLVLKTQYVNVHIESSGFICNEQF